MKCTTLMLAAGLLVAGLAWAQDGDEADAGRGVARISVINGDVSVRRGDSGDWVAAAINAPLVVGDSLLTGTGSRAEVQFDYGNFLRVGSDSEIRVSDLENKRYQVQVARGTVTFRGLRDTNADVEIDTPNISVRPTRQGMYRIAVNVDGQSEVTVRSGEVEVYSPKGTERVRSGQTMLVRGTQADPEFQTIHEIASDNFDRWNEDRDRELSRSRSYQYVSRDVYGADDLDSYGRWVYVPPYGWVWSPSGVAVDWAPYRSGRWAWVDYYGWTWVSYDPWGWAPYHYGRWFYQGGYGWCWYPGVRHHRHYWSPGLVAFFGFGSGAHVGVGFGSLGWVPLAPYEPYHRWYGRGWYGGRNTYNQVTIINNTNITNVYRNARVVNGVTGIDAGGFARGGRGGVVRVSEVARSASLMRGPIPVVPTADSQRFSDRRVTVNPGRVAEPRQFYTRRQPAPVQRVSFDQQRRGMEQYVQRTMGGQAAPARAEMNREVRGARPEVRTQQPAGAQSGWRTVPQRQTDAARQTVPQRQTEGARPTDNGNWRRIGEPAARGGMTQERNTTPVPRSAERDQVRRTAPDNARGNSEDRGNWHRFGSQPRSEAPQMNRESRQVTRGEAAPAREPETRGTPTPRSEAQGNWRQFESTRPERTTTPRVDRGEQSNFRSAPRAESPRSEPRSYESPSYDRQVAPREPVRINQQIVRERMSESPARSQAQPRMERSEPRFSGGSVGGGRSSEPSFSGGGGGRSTGGGRGRSR